MDSDRHYKSKRDDRKKDRKKKSRSKSSESRSRSSSSRSPSHLRKKKSKKGHDSSDKPPKHRETREEMPPDNDYAKNMMGFQAAFPMMKMPFEMPPGSMMPMPGMQRVYPPGFPMPSYPHHMLRPPHYPPGIMPPLPNQMDQMMHKVNRMGMKTYPDQKAAPLMKKEKEKSAKKEEESGKVLEFTPPIISAEIFRSMHISVKHLQEPLFLFTCKKILTELETRLKEKKLKSRAKEISEFISGLYDKIKEAEKKDKKKSTNVNSSNESPKISELELVKAMNEVEDIKTLLSLVNLEKFSLDNCYELEKIQIIESEESAMLFEEAKSLFNSAKDEIYQTS